MKNGKLLISFSLCLVLLFSSCALKSSPPHGSGTSQSVTSSPSENTTNTQPFATVDSDQDANTNENNALQVIDPHPNEEIVNPNEWTYSEDVVLFPLPDDMPEADTIQLDLNKYEQLIDRKGMGALYKFDDLWLVNVRVNYKSRPQLYDAKNDEIITLDRPENFPDWVVGSGYNEIVGGRYFFEWLAYDDDSVKLTRIDVESKKLDVIREEFDKSFPSMLYLKAVDDEHFLSYYRFNCEKGDEYDLYSVCELYDINGNYTEILREGYIRDDVNGVGYFYDAFTAKDGVIYALCKRIVNSKAQWYLKTLTLDGGEVDLRYLDNFGSIAGTSGMKEFDIVGDYLVASNNLSTTYVYKLNEDSSDELVIKGYDNRMRYVTSDGLIICKVSRSEKIGVEYPYGLLYVLNTENGKLKKIVIPLEEGKTSGYCELRLTTSSDVHLIVSGFNRTSYVIPIEEIR